MVRWSSGLYEDPTHYIPPEVTEDMESCGLSLRATGRRGVKGDRMWKKSSSRLSD